MPSVLKITITNVTQLFDLNCNKNYTPKTENK